MFAGVRKTTFYNFMPNPFAAGGEFRQELKLRESFVEITGKHSVLQSQLSVIVTLIARRKDVVIAN